MDEFDWRFVRRYSALIAGAPEHHLRIRHRMRSAHRSNPDGFDRAHRKARSEDHRPTSHGSRTSGFQQNPGSQRRRPSGTSDGRWRRLAASTLGSKSSSRWRVGERRSLRSLPTLRARHVHAVLMLASRQHPRPLSDSAPPTSPARSGAQIPINNLIRRSASVRTHAGGPHEDLVHRE